MLYFQNGLRRLKQDFQSADILKNQPIFTVKLKWPKTNEGKDQWSWEEGTNTPQFVPLKLIVSVMLYHFPIKIPCIKSTFMIRGFSK
jgi:hypothetical protein